MWLGGWPSARVMREPPARRNPAPQGGNTVSLGGPSAGRSTRARSSSRWVLACIASVALLCAPSCNNDDDDDGGGGGGSGLGISMSLTPPAGGATDLVFFAEVSSAGDLLLVDVIARDISDDFDGYDVEISFDPLVAEVFSLTQGTVLEGCSGNQAVKADNVSNGNANQTGSILFSAALTGPTPPACTVVGDRSLARITFRAKGAGTFALEFVLPDSRLFRTSPSVPALTIDWHDDQTTIEVN